MKHIVILLMIVLISSCKTEKNEINNFKVVYKGALKNIMHKGDITAKADLSKFKKTKHLYALGAIENLKGEIQIFNGKSFNSKVVDSTLLILNSIDNKATLLVYSYVDKWESIKIPDNITTYKQLESYIEQAAKKNKIDVNEPFPFLIEGKVKSFDWHVINWKEGDTEHSHQKHVNSGLHGTINNRKVEMLGFYSNSHHAIFTHHTTNMHIHVKTTDNKIAGHVDGLILDKGMILKLPEVK